MTMTMFQRMTRLAAGAAMAWGVVCGPTASAQQASAPPATPQAQTPATSEPQGPTLRLSMDEAVTMAMETSLGLQAAKLNLDIAAQNIVSARASFLPVITSGVTNSSRTAPPGDFTQGSQDITSRNVSFQGSSRQSLPWFGSGYSVSWNGNRSSTVGGFPTFAPGLGTSISVNFTQPLWRNFIIDGTRAAVETSERQRVITDIQLQQQIVGLESGVRNAYLGLLSAIENLKVADQNKALAEESLRGARARVNVGQAPPIDVVQAEAQVAGMEDAVIQARANILAAEDTLRGLIIDPNRQDYWTVRLEPTDTIEVTEEPIDVDAAIQNALQNRLDLQAENRRLEIDDLNLRVAKNATKPSVDLNVGYSASGTGGTRITYEGFPPVEVGRSSKSFGSTMAEAFSGAYPSWNVGVSVQYPIGNTSAEAALARAQISRRQSDLQLRQLELDIVREVRQAARDVETARQRVRATQRALDLAQQQLDAENRKFEVGISTPFERQSRESQLAQARTNHAAARIAFSRALIRFATVQKTR
jgi:HAE1 family hydrophobic/amphiphilic exporter-1